MFAQTLVMTLVSGARSAGQRERCEQKNCKTPALSVVARMCRYVDVLHTHTCAVTECSFVCTFGSSHRVPETNCVIHSHHHCFPNTCAACCWVGSPFIGLRGVRGRLCCRTGRATMLREHPFEVEVCERNGRCCSDQDVSHATDVLRSGDPHRVAPFC